MFLTVHVFSTLSCSFSFGLKFLEPIQLKFEESTTVKQCPFKNAMLFCSPPNAMLKIRKIFPPHTVCGAGRKAWHVKLYPCLACVQKHQKCKFVPSLLQRFLYVLQFDLLYDIFTSRRTDCSDLQYRETWIDSIPLSCVISSERALFTELLEF